MFYLQSSMHFLFISCVKCKEIKGFFYLTEEEGGRRRSNMFSRNICTYVLPFFFHKVLNQFCIK